MELPSKLFSNPFKRNIKAIKRSNRYNYGWTTSARESLSSTNYERYFQKMDIDFYVKTLNEALLDSLKASLEKRNIATDFLKQASTTIFNEGIIVSGGSVSASNIATGRRAKLSTRKTKNEKSPQN